MAVAASRVAEALRAADIPEERRGVACCDGPSFRGCCDVLNFFETQETAERYLRDHPEITGTSISIPGAIEAGRLVFGDLLKEN
jgi:hypothetical protein